MNAQLPMVKHPYYSVTDAGGFFKLTDVPPGEYEIEAWQEGWRIISEERALEVAAQVEVSRPIYSQPETRIKRVTVRAGHISQVEFPISEK